MIPARDRRPGLADALAYRAYQLGRGLVLLPMVGAWIPGRVRARIQARMLPGVIHRMPDRRYLEESILPALALLRPVRLLDVGVEDYTAYYGCRFPPDSE